MSILLRLARGPRWLALLAVGAAPLPAQEAPPGSISVAFDIDRAWVPDSTVYQPFFVADRDIRSLRDAVREKLLHEGTRLLVLEHEAGTLALVVEQMAYHHAAQGEMAGEPWMVSF